jgi:cyclopropane fatty-acyl-phospholipid synthase-like methyltransferase
MSFYHRLLGLPFVYNQIRPLAVGGIDLSPVYQALDVTQNDRVLDVGCGTGDALQYLHAFQEYHGFDVDPVAIAHARKRYAGRPGVRFEARLLDADTITAVQPTRVVLAGLLHHLADDEVADLFRLLAGARGIERVVTQDIVYLPNERISNWFASLDRGRYCRKPDEYTRLVKASGFTVLRSDVIRSHPTRVWVKYFIMVLNDGS